MTGQELQIHLAKQGDLKQSIQVLTPFVVNKDVDQRIKSAAIERLVELIPNIKWDSGESMIKTLNKL